MSRDFKVVRCIETENGMLSEGDIVTIITDDNDEYTGKIKTIDSDLIKIDISEKYEAKVDDVRVSSIYSIYRYEEKILDPEDISGMFNNVKKLPKINASEWAWEQLINKYMDKDKGGIH